MYPEILIWPSTNSVWLHRSNIPLHNDFSSPPGEQRHEERKSNTWPHLALNWMMGNVKVSPQWWVSFCWKWVSFCWKTTWACRDLQVTMSWKCCEWQWMLPACFYLPHFGSCSPLFSVPESWPSYPIPKHFHYHYFSNILSHFSLLCISPRLLNFNLFPGVNKTSSGDNDLVSAALQNAKAPLQGKSQEACGQRVIWGDHICAAEHLEAVRRWSVIDECSVQLSKRTCSKNNSIYFPMTCLF